MESRNLDCGGKRWVKVQMSTCTFKVWSRTDLASAMFSDYVARHGEAGLEDLLSREQIVM